MPDFGRMFLKLKYTDITKNTYIEISSSINYTKTAVICTVVR